MERQVNPSSKESDILAQNQVRLSEKLICDKRVVKNIITLRGVFKPIRQRIQLGNYIFSKEDELRVFGEVLLRVKRVLYTSLHVPSIESILHINFSKLQELNFWGAGLKTIEPLVFLDLSNLELLAIGDKQMDEHVSDYEFNRVRCVKSLAKCHLPCLYSLDLSSGVILDIGFTIPRATRAESITLSLEWKESFNPRKDSVRQQDLSFIAKLQSPKSKFIEILRPQEQDPDIRIFQSKVENTLKNKYRRIRF